MTSLQAKIYTRAGLESGTIDLPENVFGLPWNADLVHQVVTAMQANARTSTAHTKTRSEVSGGGKKPWRQKGTGRARHGSIRSPLWVGGGVTHGPRSDKDYSQKINKKMKTQALYTSLSQKLRKGHVLFVEDIALGAIKTKDAASVLEGLATVPGFETLMTKKKNNVLIAVPSKDIMLGKSFQNIACATLEEVRNLNPLEVVASRYIVIASPLESVQALLGRTKKTVSKPRTKKIFKKVS